jgi:uncharacterized membrane protein
MTSTAAVPTTQSDRDRARRAIGPVAAAVVVLAAGFTALGVFPSSPGHEAHHASEFFIVLGIVLAGTLAVFGLVVPRGPARESAGRRGTVMAVLGALLLVPVFWAGLPLVLGAGGALLGYAGKRAPRGAGWATAAYVLGLLVCIGYVAIYVGDYLHTHGIG